MIRRFAILSLVMGAQFVSSAFLRADETPSTPSTTNTTPSTTTTTEHKEKATNIVNGKVEKISDKSITIKASIQTVVEKPSVHHPKGKFKTVTQTATYEINDTPPVKVVTDGAHPTRTTGSFSDVKVGDMVMVGTSAHTTKNTDGKSTTHTHVTGIDVLKHNGATTTTTTTTTTTK